MEMQLPPDFKEFLKLLNLHQVKYLLIGGYAVGYYGYPRTTNDIDFWVAIDEQNAIQIVSALREFGFDTPELTPELFLAAEKIIRMGVPPMRIELLTTISGVQFDDCYSQRIEVVLDNVPVSMISLQHLKQNKRASNRFKDLDDLEHLP
jgi:hypothetical protein